MSYTYLLDAGEESSAGCFSDIPASVLSRLNLTGEKSCSNGSGTESYHASQSGMMSEHFVEDRGKASVMLFAEDSLVRTSQLLAEEAASMENEAGCGGRWPESFATWHPHTSSWKIRQLWLFADLDESLAIWPRWGTMLAGECLELTMPADTARGNDCGLLPRPQKVDGQKWYVVTQKSTLKRVEEERQLMLIHVVGLTAYTHLNRWLANPPFWEAMMDWPIGWTDCTPLAMAKFQQWFDSHGRHSPSPCEPREAGAAIGKNL